MSAEVPAPRAVTCWGSVSKVARTEQNSETLDQIHRHGVQLSLNERMTLAAVKALLSEKIGVPSERISLEIRAMVRPLAFEEGRDTKRSFNHSPTIPLSNDNDYFPDVLESMKPQISGNQQRLFTFGFKILGERP